MYLAGSSYYVSMDVCFSTSQMRPSEYQNVNQKKRQKKVVVGGDLYTKKSGTTGKNRSTIACDMELSDHPYITSA